MNLAVAYVRVSSKNQDIERQEKELLEYAQTKNLVIIKFFKDIISASKSGINERGGFNKLKEYLENKKDVKNILVHEVSRLGRKSFEVQNTIEYFYLLGVNIHFKDLDKSTLDNEGNKSFESNLIISILGTMAENETRLLASRIKSGLLNNARKGLAFSDKITGYIKGVDGRPVVDEKEAPLVRRMFELASKKTSLYFISKKIETEFSRKINSKTISGIIKNPFYKGERIYLGETIQVDRIVDKETWRKANNFLLSRKNFTKRYRVNENIVEGKIVCHSCNNPMYQIVIKKGRANLFKCSNRCSTSVNRPWLYEMIRYVIDKHTKHLNDEEFKNDLNIKLLENQEYILDLKNRRLENENALQFNYENFLKNKVRESIYLKTNENLENEIKSIEENLNECFSKDKSYQLALKSKPQHFSEDLKAYKIQIKDILKEVEVADDFISININGVVKYIIKQLTPSEIGWTKRKSNKEDKMIFENPFIKGITIKNLIDDDNLEMMINDQLNDNSSLIESYFKSKQKT